MKKRAYKKQASKKKPNDKLSIKNVEGVANSFPFKVILELNNQEREYCQKDDMFFWDLIFANGWKNYLKDL